VCVDAFGQRVDAGTEPGKLGAPRGAKIDFESRAPRSSN
jgi:hypothetical protein